MGHFIILLGCFHLYLVSRQVSGLYNLCFVVIQAVAQCQIRHWLVTLQALCQRCHSIFLRQSQLQIKSLYLFFYTALLITCRVALPYQRLKNMAVKVPYRYRLNLSTFNGLCCFQYWGLAVSCYFQSNCGTVSPIDDFKSRKHFLNISTCQQRAQQLS